MLYTWFDQKGEQVIVVIKHFLLVIIFFKLILIITFMNSQYIIDNL